MTTPRWTAEQEQEGIFPPQLPRQRVSWWQWLMLTVCAAALIGTMIASVKTEIKYQQTLDRITEARARRDSLLGDISRRRRMIDSLRRQPPPTPMRAT